LAPETAWLDPHPARKPIPAAELILRKSRLDSRIGTSLNHDREMAIAIPIGRRSPWRIRTTGISRPLFGR
jgi:hypothetical protein